MKRDTHIIVLGRFYTCGERLRRLEVFFCGGYEETLRRKIIRICGVLVSLCGHGSGLSAHTRAFDAVETLAVFNGESSEAIWW